MRLPVVPVVLQEPHQNIREPPPSGARLDAQSGDMAVQALLLSLVLADEVGQRGGLAADDEAVGAVAVEVAQVVVDGE